MRISDWSSDVCSSDLTGARSAPFSGAADSFSPSNMPRLGAAFSRSPAGVDSGAGRCGRSEEHTSELQSLMRTSYAVFCLTKNTQSTETASHEPPQRKTNHHDYKPRRQPTARHPTTPA